MTSEENIEEPKKYTKTTLSQKKVILENNPFTLVKWSFNPKCKDNLSFKPISCSTINKQEQKIKEHSKDSKSHNLFEYTYNKEYCKVWFDIDIDNENNGIDIEDLKELLIQFHTKMNEYLETPIDIKKMLVYMKKEFLPNNNVYSIHIIYKDTKIKYENNLKLMTILKDSKLNTLTNHLDSSNLYHPKRQLCIPNNSKPYSEKVLKLGYDNPHKSNDRIFIDFNINKKNYTKEQTKEPREYLISYIIDSYTTINLKEEIINDIVVNVDSNSKDKYKSKENVNNLPKCWINEPVKDDIVDYLISYIDDKFFTKDYRCSWLKVARNLKKLKLNDIQNENFLKYSAEMSNDYYDYDKNVDWFKNRCNIDNMPICSYKIICDTLNELSSNEYYFYSNILKYNKDDIIQYIKDKCDYDCSEEINDIEENELELELIELNDKTIIFNTTTGMLDFEDKRYNYFVEVEYQKHFIPIDNNEYTIVNHITDSIITETKDSFIRGEIDLYTASAKWSCGKSHYIVEPIINEIFENRHNEIKDKYNDLLSGETNDLCYKIEYQSELPRVVMITESNSLNSQTTTSFKNMKHTNFYNHLELNDDLYKKIRDNSYDAPSYYNARQQIEDECSIITSLESCDKVKIDIQETPFRKEWINEIDILVLDEFESICNHFESNTLTNTKSKTKKDSQTQYNHLKRMIEVSKQVIVLDADISKDRLDWLINIMNNTPHKFRERKWNNTLKK